MNKYIFIQLFIYLFIYLVIHLFVCLFIYLYIYLFILFVLFIYFICFIYFIYLFPADLVTFTGEILNGIFHFLCRASNPFMPSRNRRSYVHQQKCTYDLLLTIGINVLIS